jgi:hypothetical protein
MELNPQGEWTWTCHNCGWSLTNTNSVGGVCQECGAKGRCKDLGGHNDFDGDRMCDRGCGFNFSTEQTDLAKRRTDY